MTIRMMAKEVSLQSVRRNNLGTREREERRVKRKRAESAYQII